MLNFIAARYVLNFSVRYTNSLRLKPALVNIEFVVAKCGTASVRNGAKLKFKLASLNLKFCSRPL